MGWGTFLADAPYGRHDKTVHFLVSAVFTFSLRLSFPWVVVLSAALALGLSKELLDQTFRGQRFDWADLAADLAGVSAAYVLEQLRVTWVTT